MFLVLTIHNSNFVVFDGLLNNVLDIVFDDFELLLCKSVVTERLSGFLENFVYLVTKFVLIYVVFIDLIRVFTLLRL